MMPNKTIYVPESDLPIFERAQELAGDNLSATIARALKRFVEAREQQDKGYEEITVKVGKIAYSQKKFTGRLLAKGRVLDPKKPRHESFSVYHTAKGKFAVHVKSTPNWDYHPSKHEEDSYWVDERDDYRLDVYDSLGELRLSVPDELYQASALALNEDPVETLDI
jgi:EXLDI family protein